MIINGIYLWEWAEEEVDREIDQARQLGKKKFGGKNK